MGSAANNFFSATDARNVEVARAREGLRRRKPYLQIDSVEDWRLSPRSPRSSCIRGIASLMRLKCRGDSYSTDPASDVDFCAVVKGANEIRDRLETLGLISFCKTTGGKGLHVVTPLLRRQEKRDWSAAKAFAHEVVLQMAEDSPARYLTNMARSCARKNLPRLSAQRSHVHRGRGAVATCARRRDGLDAADWAQVRAIWIQALYSPHGAGAAGQDQRWDDYDDAALIDQGRRSPSSQRGRRWGGPARLTSARLASTATAAGFRACHKVHRAARRPRGSGPWPRRVWRRYRPRSAGRALGVVTRRVRHGGADRPRCMAPRNAAARRSTVPPAARCS